MRPPSLLLLFFLPLLMAVCAWAPSVLARDFAFDDREAIVGNPVVEGSLPAREAFLRDYWHHIGDAGHFRPLATLSLRADYAQFETWVVGYHLKNVFLHLLVVALACALAVAFLERPHPALLGLAVFAAHPALADCVAWVSGRTSMLGALGPLFGGLLIAVALRLRARGAGLGLAAFSAALGLLCGLLGKEEALVFAPAYVLLTWRHSRAIASATLYGAVLGVLIYLSLRAQALGSPLPSAPFAPLANRPLDERLLFAGRGLLEAVRLSLAPFAFSPNYRAARGFTTSVPPASWAWSGWLLFAAGAFIALRVLRRERTRPGGRGRARTAAAGGALLALLAWAPFTQVAPAGEVFAPRFLYLPLLLLAPAVGLALVRLPRSVIALLLVGICLGSWSTQAAYADREAYARAVLASVPDDVGAWNDLGLALEEAGDVNGAAEAWGQGLARDDDYARIWSNLGRHQLATGQLAEAEISLRRAVAGSKRNAVARCNLGAVLLRRDKEAEAADAYAAATRIAPGMAPAWRGLANTHLRRGELDACAQALDRALALDPADGLAKALHSRLQRERAAEARREAGGQPAPRAGSE